MSKTTVDEYLTALPDTLRPAADALRVVLDSGLSAAEGRVWHGHPVWLVDKTPVAGFKAYTSYVTFMVWGGQRVDDPSGRLQPGSRDMASVRVASVDEVDGGAFAGWLAQAEGFVT